MFSMAHVMRAMGTKGGGSHMLKTSKVRKLRCAKSQSDIQVRTNCLPLKAQMTPVVQREPKKVYEMEMHRRTAMIRLGGTRP